MALDQRRHLLLSGVLVVERLVPEAPDDEPSFRRLLPVVVAVPGVVGAGEQAPLQRLGHQYLATRGPDDRVERRQQPPRVAVGGEHDLVGLDLLERLDALVLEQLGAGLDCARRQPVYQRAG